MSILVHVMDPIHILLIFVECKITSMGWLEVELQIYDLEILNLNFRNYFD